VTAERALLSEGTWIPGIALAVLLSFAWVALTLRSGLNYHLFPIAIAAVPTAVSGILGNRPLNPSTAALAAAAGLALVWITWLVFVAIDEAPTATFYTGQPGGAIGEAAVFSLAGALGGYLWNWSR
jgi:hypothetical protein